MSASEIQNQGYLSGAQGQPWETAAATEPAPGDYGARFLRDVRSGAIALRGRLKKDSQKCLDSLRAGMLETFPEAEDKQFSGAVARLWVRWLDSFAALPSEKDALAFSLETGRRVGEILKAEYDEGVSGNLAPFLLDKRLHLGNVRDFIKMRGWLQGTIERLKADADPEKRRQGEILKSNFSSIVLRALHNAGPGYAAEAVSKLSSMMRDLDTAIRNLSSIEPEAANHLRNNRATIITRALHSGLFDYGGQAAESLPSALKDLNQRIDNLEVLSPHTAGRLRATKRTIVYRALTNGRLKFPL